MYVRVPTPTYQFVVGSGAASTDVRRTIVGDDKCTTCHVGSLYQHGNTRVDNTLMCTVCHNSASSEQSVRYGMGVDASEAYDGLVGQTFELKTMLHRIHTAGEQTEAAPFVIYRTRGIFAWAPEGAVIPNWPTASTPECQPGKYEVYGALPYSAGPPAVNPNSCQTFTQWAPTYPRLFNDCTACHVSGSSDNTPEQSEAVATTLNAGSTPGSTRSTTPSRGHRRLPARAATRRPTPRVTRTRMVGSHRSSRKAARPSSIRTDLSERGGLQGPPRLSKQG